MENSKYSWTFCKQPPKMQRFSGRLCEVAADENGRTSGLFQEWVLTHLRFGRELFYYMQFLSYDMSRSNNYVVTECSFYTLSGIVRTYTMWLMVAYKRLKAVENFKTISPNSGLSHVCEVVNYQSFYCTALIGNIFDVLDKWLLVGGSCT